MVQQGIPASVPDWAERRITSQEKDTILLEPKKAEMELSVKGMVLWNRVTIKSACGVSSAGCRKGPLRREEGGCWLMFDD